MTTALGGAHVVDALVIDLPASKDNEVSASTHFAGERQSNQGGHPEIEPIRANDGFGTVRHVYLQFDLFADPGLAEALAEGERIVAYGLSAFNVRNFALGDAALAEVITNLHYVANDAWAEGPYVDWTVVASPDPLDGMTWENQVGFNEFLVAEAEDQADVWYQWGFGPDAFTPGRPNDDPRYVSLALVPHDPGRSSTWYLVSSFASREFSDERQRPVLRVTTEPVIPEPSSLFLLGAGLLGLVGQLQERRKSS